MVAYPPNGSDDPYDSDGHIGASQEYGTFPKPVSPVEEQAAKKDNNKEYD